MFLISFIKNDWRKKTSIKINLIYFLALIYTLIEKLLYYQEIFNNTYTQEKNRIVHAFGIWLIFPFYHNLLLFFTFLYLAYIYYFCHIMFYTLGLFKVKTESDFWMLPLLTYFFQKFVYSKNCKVAMNIGGGQIKGALFNFFVVKKCPFLHLLDAALSFYNNPWW